MQSEPVLSPQSWEGKVGSLTSSDTEQAESELQDLREDVADTTKEIIKLVARRIELAKRIGQVKSRGSLPIDNEKVEDALLEEVLKRVQEPWRRPAGSGLRSSTLSSRSPRRPSALTWAESSSPSSPPW